MSTSPVQSPRSLLAPTVGEDKGASPQPQQAGVVSGRSATKGGKCCCSCSAVRRLCTLLSECSLGGGDAPGQVTAAPSSASRDKGGVSGGDEIETLGEDSAEAIRWQSSRAGGGSAVESTFSRAIDPSRLHVEDAALNIAELKTGRDGGILVEDDAESAMDGIGVVKGAEEIVACANNNPPRTRADVKILYIEDEVGLQKTIQALLRKRGFTLDLGKVFQHPSEMGVKKNRNLTLISNGDYAETLLIDPRFRNQFHIILFDFNLSYSSTSGPALFHLLKGETSDTYSPDDMKYRPLCLSYSNADDSVHRGAEMGMDGGIVKAAAGQPDLGEHIDMLLRDRYGAGYTMGNPRIA